MTDSIDPLIAQNLWEALPPLQQITTDSGRWYSPLDKPEEKYFSVTTVLDDSKSVGAKMALDAWKRSQIKEGLDPNRYSFDGDKMHYLLENYFNQGFRQPKKEDCNGRGYQLFKQYEQGFLKQVSIVPHLIEGRVFTEVDGMKYAGTIDLVASVQIDPEGPIELALIDHKSVSDISKAGSKRKGYLPQLAAYAKAIKDKYGKTIDVAYLNFASEKSFKSYRVEIEEIMEQWDQFYYKLDAFYKKGVFPNENK